MPTHAERYARYRQEKRCCSCGQALRGDTCRCEACAARLRARLKRLYRWRRARGLCVRCGWQAGTGCFCVTHKRLARQALLRRCQ